MPVRFLSDAQREQLSEFGHLSPDRPTAYFAAVIRDNAVTARDAGKAEPTGCRTYPYLVVTR